jgi:ABC-type nitrate/sulfonate/bicarbonate transport system ATPase subunit
MIGELELEVEIKMINSSTSAVKIRDLSFTYADHSGKQHPIFENLSLDISRQSITAVMGASGAGKSTLGKVLSGNLLPKNGHILWDDDFQERRDRFYIDQDPDGVYSPWLTVSANIREPLKVLRWSKESLTEHSNDIISQFELDKHADRFPKYLSGGQKSRLALARVLAWNPKLIILDEYLADLDAVTRKKVMQILKDFVAKKGMTVIMISHATSDVAAIADRCLFFGGNPARVIADINVGELRKKHSFLEVQNTLDTQIAKAQYLHAQQN